MPTVCELTGATLPEGIDGISYLPTLTGQGEQKLHDNLYFEFHEQGGKQAVIKDRWKLIRLQVNNPKKTKLELYNLNCDPGEIANVAALYLERVKELQSIMDSSRTSSEHWKFASEKNAK